jgi:hypothetical protein
MIAIPLALLLLSGAPQQASTPADLTSQKTLEQAKARYEVHRQAAIRINDLAGNIHSEEDARGYVDAVAEQLAQHRYQYWTTISVRHRVARAEYTAVSDASRLIPEQRVVNVWNEYVREIDAPPEALATVAEVHNLRDSLHYSDQRLWKGLSQSLWTMPNVEGVEADGGVSDGCRAVEALKVIYHMHELFPNLLRARERVQQGILVSEVAAPRQAEAAAPQGRIVAHIEVRTDQNPVRLAALRYQQAHGESAYRDLLKKLFDELFPKD